MVIVNGRQFEIIVENDADGYKTSYCEYINSDTTSTQGELQPLHVGVGDPEVIRNEALQLLIAGVESGQV